MASYNQIEDYGIIGNGRTTALISKHGSIDFFCFPEFDSPSIFAGLLDHEDGGCFAIQPDSKNYKTHHSYITKTNVLLTRFICDDYLVDLIDFMPFDENANYDNEIVRIVKCIRGNVTMNFELLPKFNYSRNKHSVAVNSKNKIVFKDEETSLELHLESNIHLTDDFNALISNFSVKEDEIFIFSLGEPKSYKSCTVSTDSLVDTTRLQLRATVKYWKNWIAQSSYKGLWKDQVDRSALLLKLLTSHKHGAPVAAPTFSLPEAIGEDMNWDYRYTWIRDASFTMYAFIRLGFLKEASKFMIWIKKRLENDINEQLELQIMYCVDGSRDLTESELSHFQGYKKSKPVRIGNAATNQLQLDIYGELMDTIYLFDKFGEPITYDFWKIIKQLIKKVIDSWEQPDHGIWEVRETKRHYLYSRVMCWVAVDRAIRLAEKRSFPFPRTQWLETRDQIFKAIHEEFWSDELQSFVHFKGATSLDVSIMIMPLVRCISPYSKKWESTMKAIEKRLITDVLAYRNMNDVNPKEDGNKEGTFLIGAFWYIECLSRAGELEKATYFMQKVLDYGNHLSLFAEEIDQRGQFLGNYPQAFSHLSLISTAFSLDRNNEASFKITEEYDLF